MMSSLLCCAEFERVGFFFFKQKTAYEMRISDWSSDVCSSDLLLPDLHEIHLREPFPHRPAPLFRQRQRAQGPGHDVGILFLYKPFEPIQFLFAPFRMVAIEKSAHREVRFLDAAMPGPELQAADARVFVHNLFLGRAWRNCRSDVCASSRLG